MVTPEQQIKNIVKGLKRLSARQLEGYIDVIAVDGGFIMKEPMILAGSTVIPAKKHPIKNLEAAERIIHGNISGCGYNIRVFGYTVKEAYLALLEELFYADLEGERERNRSIADRNNKILSAC